MAFPESIQLPGGGGEDPLAGLMGGGGGGPKPGQGRLTSGDQGDNSDNLRSAIDSLQKYLEGEEDEQDLAAAQE